MVRPSLLLFAALPAIAAEVTHIGETGRVIAISRDEGREWKLGEQVCAYRLGQEKGCGVVIKLIKKGALIKLPVANFEIAKGDQVQSVELGRSPASDRPELLSSSVKPSESRFRWDLTGGLNVTSSFFFPTLHLQVSPFPRITVGLLLSYVDSSLGSTTLTAFGVSATVGYYTQDNFRGFWVQGGAGRYYKSNAPTGNVTAGAFLLTAGWRGYWDLGLNIGAAAGIHYISNTKVTTVGSQASELQPLLLFDIGVNF